MTEYSTLNVKILYSQLIKLKSGRKNETKVTLNLSSNLIGHFNDEINFSHRLLLTDTQVSKICKTFANDSSVNIKFSKTGLSKIAQLASVWLLLLLTLLIHVKNFLKLLIIKIYLKIVT